MKFSIHSPLPNIEALISNIPIFPSKPQGVSSGTFPHVEWKLSERRDFLGYSFRNSDDKPQLTRIFEMDTPRQPLL